MVERPLGRPARRRGVTVGATAIVIAAFVASLLMLPPAERTGPVDLDQLADQFEARRRTDLFSARPAYLPEPQPPLSTPSPPAPLVEHTLVSKAATRDDRRIPYLVPDSALPLRYQVDRRLVELYGLERVVEAVGQWDDIPGSRWATEFVSVVDLPNRRPRAGDLSTVYLRNSCPEHFLGGAFWHAQPGQAYLEIRYGTAALYSPQIDIAICSAVRPSAFEAVMAHEVGHMMGMAHLCEPGEICWRPEFAQIERECRVMYYRFGFCRRGVTEDEHDAARHLYPTMPRLFGPTLAETSARASYATTWTHAAEHVVLASTADSDYVAAAAAALAGTLDAPLLVGPPDGDDCVTGALAEELARAADNPGTAVLVGSWPQGCEEALAPWDLEVERVAFRLTDGLAPVEPVTPALSVAVADAITDVRAERDEFPESALLVVADGRRASTLDAAVAAAVAGHRGVPLLYTEPGRLSTAVRDWLARHPTVRRVQVLGELEAISDEILDALVDEGLLVVRILGDDPTERALRLAERARPFVPTGEEDRDPVFLAHHGRPAEAAVAATVAARREGPLLLSPAGGHEGVLDWLDRREPRGGYLVGTPEDLPYPLQWRYTRHVLAGGSPVPSAAEAPQMPVGRSLTGFTGLDERRSLGAGTP